MAKEMESRFKTFLASILEVSLISAVRKNQKRFCFIDVRMLEYHTVACYFMILCYVMIRTILVQPICLLVNVVLQEKQNTFYGVVLAFSKLKIS